MTKAGWNAIYSRPKNQYEYYDLEAPYEDLPKVINFFSLHKVKSVLDLGCGIGRNLIPMAKMGFVMSGIDDAPAGIKKTAAALKKNNVHADLKTGRFQSIPFSDKNFDSIISIQTINHGYKRDIQAGFREVARVLKPKGYFFLTVPGRIAKGKIRYLLVKTAKQVELNTFIPTIGDEIGVPHHIFSRSLIKKYLFDFKIIDIWRDSRDYYCVLAQKLR